MPRQNIRLFISLLFLLPLRFAAPAGAQAISAPYVEAINQARNLYPQIGQAFLDADSPLDDATINILSKHAQLFQLLHAGAVSGSTDWGIGDGTDFQRLMSQLPDARLLANLAILHARWRWSLQDFAQAQNEFLDTLALERNITRDHPILVVKLVQIAVEENVLTHWAKLLPTAPAAQLAILPDQLAHLPALNNFAEVMQAEQAFAASRKQQPPEIAKALAPFYDAAGKLIDQTPAPSSAQLKTDLQDAAARLPDANARAMANILASSLSVFGAELRGEQIYLEMFKTGITIFRDGPATVRNSSDPGSNGPFDYSKTGNGFELTSKLVLHTKPVKLSFGS
jgi:hypothetical protein